MKTIKEKMLESNKARTDLLSDNPEINSKWTPNALEIMKAKKANKIDFTQDSEYKRMYESKPNKKTMERKGGDTCSTETSGQNSQED
tara:strand:+ start:386 stop:646 length:261 start_codon:yes stop_codon:yes gene_type:complete